MAVVLVPTASVLEAVVRGAHYCGMQGQLHLWVGTVYSPAFPRYALLPLIKKKVDWLHVSIVKPFHWLQGKASMKDSPLL